MIKTKLIATIGPACDNEPILSAMLDAGVSVFRLNFSHGTLEGHLVTLQRIRRVAAQMGKVVAVLGDLCGPKIRLGTLIDGRCELSAGCDVAFVRNPIEGTGTQLWSNYKALIDDVQPGDRVLIDDGNIQLRAVSKMKDQLLCHCEVGGWISDHKGINLPDSNVSAPALTKKDLTDLAWAIDHELDFVALSFVRHPDDVHQLRTILNERDPGMRIVTKIEKPDALAHIDEIIALADGIMVARGDLGVEMDLARVPVVQKELALKAQQAGKPVIIATQMLQSMVDNPIPTRAEVSDVANAILDRTDGIMLSAESAVGRFPVEAVRQMRSIAEQTESFGSRYIGELGTNRGVNMPVETAMLRGINVITRELNPPLVVIWTDQGQGPTLLSKYRLPTPIIGLAPNERCCRQLAICYGVTPVLLKQPGTFREMLVDLNTLLLENGLVERGAQIVVAADAHPDIPGETDVLFIHVVGSTLGNE